MIKKTFGRLGLFAVAALLIVGLSSTVSPVLAVDTIGDQPVDTCLQIIGTIGYRSTDATTNGQVSDLQDFLIAGGYLSGSTTGFFGLKTVAALQKFQAANGIKTYGSTGAITNAKIKEASCKISSEATAVSPAPTQNPAPIATAPIAVPNPAPTSNATTGALQSQIQELIKQINALKGQTSALRGAVENQISPTPASALSPTPVPPTPISTSASGNYPSGCLSFSGYSATTGQPCSNQVAVFYYRTGCTSASGYSATDSKSCSDVLRPSSISSPSLGVFYPNFGAEWIAGNTYDIQWDAIGDASVVGAVNIALSDATSGPVCGTIVNNYVAGKEETGKHYFYKWTVPTSGACIPSHQLRIQITSSSYPGINAHSAADLSISLPASANASYPSGCTSTSGYSATTSQSCAGYPSGCTSFNGYSAYTGQSCSAATQSNTLDTQLKALQDSLAQRSGAIPVGCDSVSLQYSQTTVGGQLCAAITGARSFIAVTSPSGGETWTARNQYTIQWNAGGSFTQDANISLYSENRPGCNIGSAPATNGKFSFAFPQNYVCQDNAGSPLYEGDYRVLIAAGAGGSYNTRGFSNIFHIQGVSTSPVPPTPTNYPSGCNSANGYSATTGQPCSASSFIKITSQTGTETWKPGEYHVINWSESGVSTMYFYLQQGGNTDKLCYLGYVNSASKSTAGDWGFTLQSECKFQLPGGGWSTQPFASSAYQVMASDRQQYSEQPTTSPVVGRSGYVYIAAASSTQPSITVTSPNGGENLMVGQTYNITWKQVGMDNVDIVLVDERAGPYEISIASGVGAASGVYKWKIPSSVQPDRFTAGYPFSPSFLLKLVAHGSNGTVSDQSDKDFVIAPQIMISSPTGNEIYSQGASYTTKWQSTASVGANVKITVCMTEGSYQQRPTGESRCSNPVTVSNNGVYTTTLGAAAAIGRYYVYIEDTNNSDYSSDTIQGQNYAFNVVAGDSTPTSYPPGCTSSSGYSSTTGASCQPSATILSPNGGETYKIGDTLSIRWNSSGAQRFIINLLKYSDTVHNDGGTTITTDAPASAGSYNWVIPSSIAPGTMYKMSVGWGGLGDISDSFFSIASSTASQPSITVSAPRGGDVWTPGGTYLVKWSASNLTSAYVSIGLVRNSNGTYCNLASASTPTNGLGSFNLPLNQGRFCAEGSNTDSFKDDQYTVQVKANNGEAGGQSAPINITSTQPSITVTSPAGGERWVAGSTYSVNWSSTGVSYVNIYGESRDNNGTLITPNITIANNIAASAGTYSWTVPASYQPGMFRVFVSPTTNGANTISNPYPAPNFYIISASQPSVTVMSPKGGDHLEMVAGSNYTITWQAKDVQSFKVYDCFSAGDTGQTQGCTLLTGSNPYLIDSASGKYGYNWSINAQYKVNTIKVVDADHPDVSGSSGEWYWWPQAPQPSITITSPQAGTSTTWTNGQTYNITWTSTGLDSVFILLDNGSAGYINVGNVTASSGLYSFTVPSTAKGTYSVTMKKGQNDGTAFTSGGTVVIPGTSSSSADKSAQIASIQAAIKLLSGQLAEAQR